MEALRFANLVFRGTTRQEVLRDIGEPKLIVTVNAEIIVQANLDARLAGIINRGWATLDGQWPYLLANWRSGNRGLEKISGSDFVDELCALAATRKSRVFLLGANAEVNHRACTVLRSRYGIEVEGYAPPVEPYPFSPQLMERVVESLRAFRPEIVVIALGSPKQEYVADDLQHEFERLQVRWVIGAGGTLDFVAGRIRRAPVTLQKLGLEWLWRLALEPRTRLLRTFKALRFLQYA